MSLLTAPHACPFNAPSSAPGLPVLDAGHGPEVVVLLHSSLGSKGQWRPLIERMRHSHRLIAVDLYGYGAAPKADGLPGFCLADEVSRVRALMDERLPAGAPVHLVGHSYGGAVALRLAIGLGRRVRSLALYEPTSFHAVPAADATRLAGVRNVAAALQQGGSGPRPTAVARFVDFWNGERSFEALSWERRQALLAAAPKLRLDFQALFDPRCRAADYRAIAAPVLLLGGDHSPSCARAVLAALAQVLPKSELRLLPAGHMGPVTHAPLVNEVIASFLGSPADRVPTADRAPALALAA